MIDNTIKNAEAKMSIDGLNFYINKENTIAWSYPIHAGSDAEADKGNTSGIKSLYSFILSTPRDCRISLPKKLLDQLIRMGRKDAIAPRSDYFAMNYINYWQISLRGLKVSFIPFATINNYGKYEDKQLDFSITLERGYVGEDKDFFISHAVLKEVVKGIPGIKQNKNVTLSFNDMGDGGDQPISLEYTDFRLQKVVSLQKPEKEFVFVQAIMAILADKKPTIAATATPQPEIIEVEEAITEIKALKEYLKAEIEESYFGLDSNEIANLEIIEMEA